MLTILTIKYYQYPQIKIYLLKTIYNIKNRMNVLTTWRGINLRDPGGLLGVLRRRYK